MNISRALIDTLSFSFLRRDRDSSVSGTIRPSTDSVYNLGSDGRRFSYVYADTVVADTFSGSVTGNADTVDNLHAQTTPTPNYLLALDGSSTFPQSVYPNALLVDGSRNLTGNLLVSAGVTIDGVDISAHAGDLNIHVDHTAVTMIAGNGLTGGGDIDVSRTFDVGAGDGLTVSADAIALTTPGTLTTSSGNSSTGNHTHAVQSSSDVVSPGGVSYILKASTVGYLGLARLGIGVSSPQTLLDVRAGTSVTVPVSDEVATFQDNANMSIGLYAPNANISSLKFGTPSATVGGLIQWDYTNALFYIGTNVTGGDVVIRVGVSSEIARFTPTGLGIGKDPDYPLEIQSTGTQFRIEYTDNLGLSLIADASGHSYLYADGNFVFRRLQADTDANFYFRGNNNAFINIASNYDSSGTNQGGILFSDTAALHWGLWKGSNNNLQIYDYTNTGFILNIASDGSILWEPASTGVFNIRKGGEQLRLGYDGLNFVQFIVSSSGVMTLDATGDAIVFQTNNKIGSVEFTSQSEGWEMTYAGNLDCRYIYADELRVQAFTAEVYMSLVGAIVLTKSRGKLSRDFIVPYGEYTITGVDQTNDYFIIDGNYHSTTWPGNGVAISVSGSTGNDDVYYIDHSYYDSIGDDTWIYVTSEIPSAVGDGTINGLRTFYCEDLEELPGQGVFAVGDYVKLRVMDMSGGGLIVADVWGTIQVYTDQTGGEGAYSYKVIDDGGYYGNRVYTGSIALDYGTSGDGIWEATVLDQGNSPYTQVTTWATDPTLPANYTTWVRTGNLDGIGTLTEQYGIWMGQGTDELNDSQIIMSNLGARIINTDLYVRASGTNRVIAHTDGYISAGASAPTTFGSGVGFWAGMDSTYAKIMIGNTSGNWLSYDSNTGYLDIKSGANTYGRWDAGTITLGLATGAGGRAVLSSTGVFLYGNNVNTVQIQSGGDVIIGQTTGTVGNLWFDYSASTLYLRRGGTNIISLPSSGNASIVGTIAITGTVTAGAGDVILDSTGLTVMMDTGSNGYIKFQEEVSASTLAWISSSSYYSASLYHGILDIYTTKTGTGIVTRVSYHAFDQAEYHYQDMQFLGGTWDIIATGGIALGTTTNPAAGEVFNSGDHVMGGGLMVGSTAYTTDVTNGHIWFNDNGLRIYDNGSNYLRIWNANGYVDIGASSGGSLSLTTGESEFWFGDPIKSSSTFTAEGLIYYDKANSFVVNLGSSGYTDITHNFNITSYTNSFWVINGDYPANGFTVIGIDYQSANVLRVYHTGGSSGGSARFNIMWMGNG